MTAKDKGTERQNEQASQIVRQFAWNLAGTLARRPTRPAGRPGKR